MPWFVLYTKSRNEKIVAERLKEIDVEVYCPVLKKEKQWSDRKKIVEEPLFSSYIFVQIEEKERQVVFEVPGAVRYLYWLQKPAEVRPEEIQAIKDMLNDFDHSEIQLEGISLKDTIRFKSGPFIDTEGTVESIAGKKYGIILSDLQIRIFVDSRNNKLEAIKK
jgi:transcriptional antiterminator RfaH